MCLRELLYCLPRSRAGLTRKSPTLKDPNLAPYLLGRRPMSHIPGNTDAGLVGSLMSSQLSICSCAQALIPTDGGGAVERAEEQHRRLHRILFLKASTTPPMIRIPAPIPSPNGHDHELSIATGAGAATLGMGSRSGAGSP